MKRIFIGLLSALYACCAVCAQQSYKPTVMVLPDKMWMTANGFVEEKTHDSITQKCYHYIDALSQNRDMSSALFSLQQTLLELGYQVIDRETIVSTPEANVNINLLAGKLHPDFMVYLGYTMKANGPLKDVSFSLVANDAYCGDVMAQVSSTAERTIGSASIELRKMIAANAADFHDQMINYMYDLRDRGRKVNLRFTVAPGATVDFVKTLSDGQPLSTFLYQWIGKHVVDGTIKKGRQQSNLCEFRQLRILFFDAQGYPVDPNLWAHQILDSLMADSGLKMERAQDGALGYITFVVGD